MTISKLHGRHISILMALQEEPMISVSELTERISFSQATLYKDLKWLSGEHPKSKFRYFRVVPDFNEAALGLETVDVMIQVSNFEQYAELEEILDNHPYTKYRIRTHGATNGLFVQFRIPHGTSKHIVALLESLRDMNKLGGYRILPTREVESVYTVSRLKNWDLKTFSWSFDVGSWAASKHRAIKYCSRKKEASRLDLLKKLDIKVMCHLTRGARRKHSQIIDALSEEGVSITSQDFSRRLKLINANFVDGYRMFIDADAFDLWSNVLVTASVTKEFSEDLRGRIQSGTFPFRSTMKLSEDFLLWFIRLPPGRVTELVNYLHSTTSDMNLSLADYRRSEVYCLWDEAFEEEQHEWKKDRSFMVDSLV